MFIMKYFIIGLFIGIVSFIPGISGGTILYLSGEYHNFTLYLTNFKKYYAYILLLLFGALVGILTFAKIIELGFQIYPNALKLFFAYLVFFSLFPFLKKEKVKIKILPLLLALVFLLFLATFIPESPIIYEKINLSLPFLAFFTLCGFLDGFITIIPGISGSMIMMILGPYFLYKSLSAQVFTNPLLFIPLVSYFLGDATGILLGAKFTNHIINQHKSLAHSLILGLVIASLIIILPFKEMFSFSGLIILVIAYIIYELSNIKA